MNDIEFIADLLDSYFSDQNRALENSGSCSPAYYVTEQKRIDEERGEAMSAVERIRVLIESQQ